MRLWDKGVITDNTIHHFTVGNDYLLDLELLPFDCLGSMAHAEMLHSIDILNADELKQIRQTLKQLLEQHQQGQFKILPEQEDCHTAIEAFLTQKLGETGKKVHTGRSRNDQVIAATRLMVREKLMDTVKALTTLSETLIKRCEEGFEMAIPGYTHMRQAMPSTMGHLLSAYSESLTRDLEQFTSVMNYLNRNPLGSASGYGVPLPLNRELVAEKLGFNGLDRNALYVQNTRGKLDSMVIACLLQVQIDLSRLAQDLILFSMEEFQYIKLPDRMTTGSSIMPQKRNPDVLELIRGNTSKVLGWHTEVIHLISHLPAGYQRDLQLSKEPLLNSLNLVTTCTRIMEQVIDGLVFQKEEALKRFTPDIFATDKALDYVEAGMSFREAYKKAASDNHTIPDIQAVLARRQHAGAPNDNNLAYYRQLIQEANQKFKPFEQAIEKAWTILD